MIPFKQYLTEADKEINHFRRIPALVFCNKMNRHFIMRNGHDRLNPVFQHFIKECIVIFQSFFIRQILIPVWENAGPVEGCTKAAESHFLHQCKIFLIGMIEINAVPSWIIAILILQCFFDLLSGMCKSNDMLAVIVFRKNFDISHGRPFSIDIPCALRLICGNSTTP